MNDFKSLGFDAVTEDQVREWEWKNSVIPELQRSGIEPMFHRRITDWKSQEQEEVFDATDSICNGRGSIVALVGKRGCGKTTIATQVIIRRAEKAVGDRRLAPWMPYRKMAHLSGRLKGLYGDFGSIDTESLGKARESLCNAHLLVIDEMHECEDMRLAGMILTDLIDIRYARLRDTILISNHSVKEFQANTNDSILSRLSHFGSIIPCNWKSFRAPK